MRLKFPHEIQRGWLAVLPLLMIVLSSRAGAAQTTETIPTTEVADSSEMKFEVQLIWATNDKKSPNPKHKPVEPKIRKKLDEIPLKWESYFEVNRKEVTVPKGGKNKSPLSDKCAVEVKDIDGKKVEVSLFSKKTDAVISQTQPLPKGEILLLSGNAPDKTAWFVAVKRIE
jgi:hypothetical protein